MTFQARATVSSEQLAAVLGLTPRRVQQLETEGVIENVSKNRGKRFVLAEAVQAYIRKSEMDARRDADNANTSKERFEFERARKLKLENDQLEHTLVATDDAIAAVDHVAGSIRAALAGLPVRITQDITERRRIETLIDDTLRELADHLAQAGAALASGRDPLAPDTAIDATRLGEG